MSLVDHIPENAIVALDTSPWIYVFEANADFAPILRPLFDERFANGKNQAGASVLVLGELLVQPLSQGRPEVADAYRQFFRDPARVSVWTVDHLVVEQAADLRARYRLKMVDALHVACAIQHSAAAFITNDAGIRRVTEIPVLVLSDFVSPATDS